MLSTAALFLFPGDKENISVTRGEKRRHHALMDTATNGPKRPLLKRVISSLSSLAGRKSPPRISITILTDPALVSPIHSSPARERSPLSPLPPHTYTVPSLNPTSFHNARSSSPSVRLSHSPPHITIISDPAREKQRAEQQGSTHLIQSKQKAHVATLAAMRVPTTTPISILKKPGVNAVKEVEVTVLIPAVVVHEPVSYEAEANTGAHHLGTDMDTDTTSGGEILGVPAVNSRGRLHDNDIARYYPKEHESEQIVLRFRSIVRSGRRQTAASRREHARRCRQTVHSTVLFSDLFVVSRTGLHIPTPTPF